MRYREVLEACWKGYHKEGMKTMFGKRYPNCVKNTNEELEEDLRKWFKEKWVRFGPDGKIRGDCARGDDSEGKPKCLPQSKAHSLGKKGRASAAARKRRQDPNPERSGPAINVNTKKKSNEDVAEGKQPGKPVVDAIQKVLPVAQEIWFHGSRATGRHRRNSDTDILVVVPDDLVGDQYLGVVRILQKLSSHFDNYDIQPTKSGTNIHRIAQEEGRLLWSSKQGVAENFADGKKPGRKGLAKRVGVNCKQPVSKLRSIAANSSGERQRMAHWCANMKSGKKK